MLLRIRLVFPSNKLHIAAIRKIQLQVFGIQPKLR